MSLQGFSSRSIQALTNKLQAFGSETTPQVYSPCGICVFDGNVYIIDIAEQKLKKYTTSGTKVTEINIPEVVNPPAANVGSNVSDKIFIDGTYVIITRVGSPAIYDMSLSFDFEIINSIARGYFDLEFYLFANQNKVFVYDFAGASLRNWTLPYKSFSTSIYLDSGYVYLITNRSRTFGQAVTSMLKYNTSGTLIDKFDYWEIPGFPDPPDKIGRFKLHVSGSVSYSVDYGSKIIYTNSTSTGAQIDTFTLPEYVGDLFFYNSELYVTYIETGKVAVVDPTDGTLIRDWTAS